MSTTAMSTTAMSTTSGKRLRAYVASWRTLTAVGIAALTALIGGVARAGEPLVRVLLYTGSAASAASAAKEWRVRGRVDVVRGEHGFDVVNELPIEDYVAGTLGREMSPSWAPEALRAQAVASRTYALHQMLERSDHPWHLRADTLHQVYGGLDAEAESVHRARDTTRGEVLLWQGRPILAAFHATAGGRTASSAEIWGRSLPYLKSQEVAGEDASPHTYWRLELEPVELQRALGERGERTGAPRELRVVERSESGRVRWLELQGERATMRLSGRGLRAALGTAQLRSTLFEIRRDPERGTFVIAGSGHGHGVGMSQWGARALAERGAGYREILSTFYPGTELAHWRAFGAVPSVGGPR